MKVALVDVQIRANEWPLRGNFISILVYLSPVYFAVYPSVKCQENRLLYITTSSRERGGSTSVCVWACLFYSLLNSQRLTFIFLSTVIFSCVLPFTEL